MITPCKSKTLNGRTYKCFFELTLSIIGGKWKPVILYHLAREGIMRFGELRRSIPDVTERMLTKQLRELEADGLVARKVYRQVPPKVEYSLKPMGVDLIPILVSLRAWGVAYEREMTGGRGFTDDAYEPVAPPEIAAMYSGMSATACRKRA